MEIQKNEITITEEESKCCKLCGKIFESNRKMIWHVRKEHNLDFENYIVNTFYNGTRPVCLKTGNSLSFKANKLGPWFSNFSKNNFPRKPHLKETKQKIKEGCERTSMKKFGVKNVFSTDWCKEKLKKTWIKKYGVDNPAKHEDIKKKSLHSYYDTLREKYKDISYIVNYKESSLERDFLTKLENAKIKYLHPFVLDGKKFDFLIKDVNLIIEIDGETYHKDKLENLFFGNIIVALNDNYKNRLVLKNKPYNLIRIRYYPTEFSFSNLQELLKITNKFEYHPDYNIKYKQKIYTKSYLQNIKNNFGINSLKKMTNKLFQFLRTFHPDFPYPDLEENIGDIQKKIANIDLSKIYNTETREFSNNISTIGHNYLKHHFHSYWGSKFNGNLSPTEAWNDDKIMKEIIEYRIGCNTSGEVFDFSLHQIIRGMSARRITVSFFKPLLAAAIYKHYLGDINNPAVLDPCSGFGGRLLGFKSVYPGGTYIGVESNKQTYDELVKLVNEAKWDNVILINKKFEDVDLQNIPKSIFTFTSIPYFDREIYTQGDQYESFEKWQIKFISTIEKIGGQCLINCGEDIANKIGWNHIDAYIKSNRSHFDKRSGKKKEVIVKI